MTVEHLADQFRDRAPRSARRTASAWDPSPAPARSPRAAAGRRTAAPGTRPPCPRGRPARADPGPRSSASAFLHALDLDRRLDDVLQRRAVREQVEVLEHHADVAALLGGVAGLQSRRACRPFAVADQVAVDVEPARRSTCSRWLMQRRNVDLPEPDGPTRHSTSPRADLERDALEHLQRAEALAHPLGLHHRVASTARARHAPRPGLPCALAERLELLAGQLPGRTRGSSTAPGSTGRPSARW